MVAAGKNVCADLIIQKVRRRVRPRAVVCVYVSLRFLIPSKFATEHKCDRAVHIHRSWFRKAFNIAILCDPAQAVEKRETIDWRRTALFASFGASIIGFAQYKVGRAHFVSQCCILVRVPSE